ncbi:MAG: hypothetical protein QOF51_883 [Chloroflexota bacterium]|nr:hypothetical protein [Chloroflexota bacterium]
MRRRPVDSGENLDLVRPGYLVAVDCLRIQARNAGRIEWILPIHPGDPRRRVAGGGSYRPATEEKPRSYPPPGVGYPPLGAGYPPIRGEAFK